MPEGMSLTEVARHSDARAKFDAASITIACLDAMARDAVQDTAVSGTLGEGNAYDPDTNPNGFPSTYDRSVTCKEFLKTREGKDTGCNSACTTFVTKNGAAKGMVRLACPVDTCDGFRSMVTNDRDKGPTAMLSANRVLIKKCASAMKKQKDLGYEVRVQGYCNVLLAHRTLVIGWLAYEAKQTAFKAKLHAQHSGMATTTKGKAGGKGTPRGGKGKGKGKAGGKGKGTYRGASSSQAPSPRRSPSQRTPTGRGTPMSTSSRGRDDRQPSMDEFMAWTSAQRARSHGHDQQW